MFSSNGTREAQELSVEVSAWEFPDADAAQRYATRWNTFFRPRKDVAADNLFGKTTITSRRLARAELGWRGQVERVVDIDRTTTRRCVVTPRTSTWSNLSGLVCSTYTSRGRRHTTSVPPCDCWPVVSSSSRSRAPSGSPNDPDPER